MVLDLGSQPAADHFPLESHPLPDPAYPLRMWLCASCGLAQLLEDGPSPEEPLGTEPAALGAQAALAVSEVVKAGLLGPGLRVAEYGSPHGGSWLALLTARGLSVARDGEPCEVVLDCFGMMHAADQATALAERARRLDSGGVLLLQYHSLDAVLRLGQWNALRHGHFAYYSSTALLRMLEEAGLFARAAWRFDLYGGTVLLAAGTEQDPSARHLGVESLLSLDERVGVTDAVALGSLQRAADSHGARFREWLLSERTAGRAVVGYGAASRAAALLVRARVDKTLLEAVVDSSPAKHGRRMPGVDVPIVGPEHLAGRRPRTVVLFVPDLFEEVRAAFPGVESAGGRWVDAAAFVA